MRVRVSTDPPDIVPPAPPDGLNEPSSVIHRLIFGDEGDDTAAVPQV